MQLGLVTFATLALVSCGSISFVYKCVEQLNCYPVRFSRIPQHSTFSEDFSLLV